ncbi:hypothetical protein SPWS13_2997 [Shewanella putrefaciens]|nr:hypothetical protein SPWS13_2997 [Shewanella putrefaciens]
MYAWFNKSWAHKWWKCAKSLGIGNPITSDVGGLPIDSVSLSLG